MHPPQETLAAAGRQGAADCHLIIPSPSLSLSFFLYSIRRRGRESLAFYLRRSRVSTRDSYSRGVTQLREQTRGSSDCKGHGRIEIGFTAFLRMFAALSQSRL